MQMSLQNHKIHTHIFRENTTKLVAWPWCHRPPWLLTCEKVLFPCWYKAVINELIPFRTGIKISMCQKTPQSDFKMSRSFTASSSFSKIHFTTMFGWSYKHITPIKINKPTRWLIPHAQIVCTLTSWRANSIFGGAGLSPHHNKNCVKPTLHHICHIQKNQLRPLSFVGTHAKVSSIYNQQ